MFIKNNYMKYESMDKVKKDKIIKLSSDIMSMSKNILIVNFRFMSVAIVRLLLSSSDYVKTNAVDGEKIYFNPFYIVKLFNQNKEAVVRKILHMTLHCIFRHFYVGSLIEQRYWNLACDIAVENIINDLDLSNTYTIAADMQKDIILQLRDKVKYLTAENLYRYFLDEKLSCDYINNLEQIFTNDEHDVWYLKYRLNGDEEINMTNDFSSLKKVINTNLINKNNISSWENVSRQIQIDLETFSKTQGEKSSCLMQNLVFVNREKYNYVEFLKKFAVMGEVMCINDLEFDYVYYTYGLRIYGNIPLIEPLEYKVEKRIKEFVIAIDTSSSTSGKLVQKFIENTYNILMEQESFFTKINIHIIQCDAEIQEDIKITSREEFDEYLKIMKIKGLGGTDFRPVFSYVNNLIIDKEFIDLKGLIYFTDGFGIFPSKKPEYNTAFVYVNDECINPDVPVWAIKLVLRSDEI